MRSFEFETICRWIAARLRRRGLRVVERDVDFMDAVASLGLRNVAEAVGVGEDVISALARRLGLDRAGAA